MLERRCYDVILMLQRHFNVYRRISIVVFTSRNGWVMNMKKVFLFYVFSFAMRQVFAKTGKMAGTVIWAREVKMAVTVKWV